MFTGLPQTPNPVFPLHLIPAAISSSHPGPNCSIFKRRGESEDGERGDPPSGSRHCCQSGGLGELIPPASHVTVTPQAFCTELVMLHVSGVIWVSVSLWPPSILCSALFSAGVGPGGRGRQTVTPGLQGRKFWSSGPHSCPQGVHLR